MAMQPVYLVSVKNLPKFLESIRHAQAPEKLSLRFVEQLGFTSTNDRLFIPLLKAMKFIDEAGKPSARFHEFLDDTQWKRVLAEGVRDAYLDLFRVNRNANTMSREALSGKIKSLTEGKASDAVLANTTKTFLELVKLADFTDDKSNQSEKKVEPEPKAPEAPKVNTADPSKHKDTPPMLGTTTLVYRIEIVLPAVRDQAVYDSIFRSVKDHLLR